MGLLVPAGLLRVTNVAQTATATAELTAAPNVTLIIFWHSGIT